MEFHRFEIASLAAAPWKNGGGTTREIVRRPEGAGIDNFDWRVSIATVGADGAFSCFSGVDRVIVLLDGAGMRLRSPDGRIDHLLNTLHVPCAFEGEVALDCNLLGQPCSDFNVMTRRDRRRVSVRVLSSDSDIAQSTGGVLLALSGVWKLHAPCAPAAIVCQQGNGVWWDNGAQYGWRASTFDTDAALIETRIDPAPSAIA